MFTTTLTYRGFDGLKKSTLNREVKKLMQKALRNWHKNTLPRHFRRGAAGRYGYMPRDKKYNRYKQRRYGHSKPLVKTGDLQRMVSRAATIRGTSKRARASMKAPRYLYTYKPGQPDKADEITRLTPDEASKMAIELDRNLEVNLKQYNKKRTVRL